MIPQYESTGEWVQRIEEQKRSEPSKKRKKKPTDPNNFEPGQELEFNINDTVIKGKFIRYDLEDEEKILIETTYDMLYEHGLNSNAPGSVQRVHKSWLVEKKKPTGILKDLLELKRCGCYSVPNKEGKFVEWSDVEAIINKYMNP